MKNQENDHRYLQTPTAKDAFVQNEGLRDKAGFGELNIGVSAENDQSAITSLARDFW